MIDLFMNHPLLFLKMHYYFKIKKCLINDLFNEFHTFIFRGNKSSLVDVLLIKLILPYSNFTSFTNINTSSIIALHIVLIS